VAKNLAADNREVQSWYIEPLSSSRSK